MGIVKVLTVFLSVLFFIYIYTSGGPLSALTCCVNVRLLSGDKKNIAVNLFSKLGWELGLYYASYDDFHPDILARMYLAKLHCRGRERVFELEAGIFLGISRDGKQNHYESRDWDGRGKYLIGSGRDRE